MSQRNFLLEGTSAFFVNEFYNNVYSLAKSSRKGSLTESYQERVSNYVRGIKTVEQIFKTLCSNIHRYICKSARFSSMMYGEFVDKLIANFTPSDYFEMLTRDQKDELFSSIINDLASTLGTFCLRPNILRKIIDEHDTAKAITQDLLFREALSILSRKQEELMHSFVRNISQSKDMISAEVAEKYKRQIEDLNEEVNRLLSEIASLESELEEKEEKEIKYRKIIDLLQKSRITVQSAKPQPKIEKMTEVIAPKVEDNIKPSSPDRQTVLTTENLNKHLEDPKNKPRPKHVPTILDEDSNQSSEEILQKQQAKADSNSLSSGKKSLLDNIDGLLVDD